MKIRYIHKYFGVVMVLLVSLLLGFSSHRMAYAQTQIELVSTTYSTQSSLWGSWIQHWGKELEKRTNGQVRIKEYFWSGSLLQAAATTEGVGKGMADIGFAVVGYNPASYPLTLSALNIAPYAMGPGWVVPHVINELWDEYAPFRKELHDLNLEYLFNICGAESVIGSTKVIRNIEDLKGEKIRAIGTWHPILKRLGAIPVATPAADVYVAIQRKQLTGFAGFPLYMSADFRLEEVVKQYLDPGFGVYGGGSFYVMNKTKYDKLPDSAKKVIADLRREMADYVCETQEKRDREHLIDAVARGIEIRVLSPDEMAKWKEMVQPEDLWDEWLGPEGPGKGLPAARELFNLYREKAEKLQAQKSSGYSQSALMREYMTK